jgi:MarR family transcriptional regulator, organic hydroperoxide resistance regulator
VTGEPAFADQDECTPRETSSPLVASLCQQLVVVGDDLAEVFERVTRRSGLTLVQYNALHLLARVAPEAQEPWQLAQVLGIGSNHITVVLDRLEQQAFVTRGPHPNDGRRRLVRLTPAGQECTDRTSASLRELERQLVDSALEPAEQRELQRLSAQLRHAIRELVIPVRGVRPGP